MSKIDKRIVEMEFRHGQFTSGVDKTVNAMEKLKSSLNVGNIASDVDNISSKFSLMGVVGFTAINKITEAAMGAGAKVVRNVIDPIVQGGQKRALNLEQSRFQLMGLLKDAVKVETVMDDVSYAVDGTAYGLDAAAMAAASLAASNIEAGEQMKNYLRGISGVAAMTGSSYEDISNVFTKVAGQGRVMGDDLRRMEARGMNAAAAVAKHFSMTEAEVRDATSKGKISADMFAEAMNEAFGPHASKANETYAGSLSNVKAALARLGQQYYLGIDRQNPNGYFERQRMLFVELIPLINKFGQILSPIMDSFNKIKYDNREALVNSIRNFTENYDPSKMIEASENIGKVMRNLYEGVKSVTDPIKRAFSEVFGGAGSAIENGILSFSESLANLTSKMKLSSGAAEVLESVFVGLFGVIKSVFRGIGIAWDFVSSIFSSFGEGIKSIKDSTSGMDTSKWSQGVRDMVSALRELGSGFMENIGPLLVTIGEGIGSVMSTIAKWINENISFRDVMAGLVGGGIFQAAKSFTGMVDSLKEGVNKFFEMFSTGTRGPSQFSQVLDSLTISLSSFTRGINIIALSAVAIAITLLASAVSKLAEIDIQKLIPAIATLGTLFAIFATGMRRISEVIASMKSMRFGGLMVISVVMLSLATSINILTKAVVRMAELDLGGLARGLGGLFGTMKILMMAMENKAFSSGISLPNAVLMLAFAVTLASLARTMRIFAEMSWDGIKKGLSSMLGVVGILVVLSKNMGKTTGSWGSAVLMLSFALSLKSIAKTLETLGGMDWASIFRGLGSISGIMIIMVLVSKSMSKIDKGSIASSGSILLLSLSLLNIGKAMQQLSSLSWQDIAKALTAIASTMTIMTIVSRTLAKGGAGAFKSIGSAAAILILSFSLLNIGKALKMVADISWGAILLGMLALNATLVVMGGVLLILGASAKIALGALVAAGAILLASFALKNIGSALKIVSDIPWQAMLAGMLAISATLVVLGGVLMIMGASAKIAFGALVGATALLLASKSLMNIAEALQVLGSMSWGEIGRGITAMLGVLAALSVGLLAAIVALPGAIALNMIAKPLGDLADSVNKWKDVTVPSNLNSQLSDLAKGVRAFSFAQLGGWGLSSSAKPLGDLADSVKKWKSVSVPNGITRDLEKLADGVKKFSLAQLGGWGLSSSSKPLGDLADSVSKWENVKVPSSITSDLESLASGVKSFSFAQLGGWGISTAAKPLSDLADGVKKFSNLNIDPSIASDMETVAEGVKSFTWAFMGGWSISSVTGPMNDLAESMQVWENVTVPSTIEDDLKRLANGVDAFQWSFFTGGQIDSIAGPFGVLADSTRKWSSVSISPSIGDDLQSLAEGLNAFRWSFFTGGQIDSIAGPFGVLADSTAKWANITVPSDIGESLQSLADGVHAFKWEFFTGGNIDSIAGPFGELATATQKWSDVYVRPGIGEELKELSDGLDHFGGFMKNTGSKLGDVVDPLNELADAVSAWENVRVPPGLGTSLGNLSNALDDFVSKVSDSALNKRVEPTREMADAVRSWSGVTVSSSIQSGLTGLAAGLTALGEVKVDSTISDMISSIASSLDSLSASLQPSLAEVSSWGTTFSQTFETTSSEAVAAVGEMNRGITSSLRALVLSVGVQMVALTRNMVSSVTAMRPAMYSGGYSAGNAISQGLRAGILSGGAGAISAAITIANQALRAAKSALAIKSPSRAFAEVGEFAGEGLAIGMLDSGRRVEQSAEKMAKSALTGTLRVVDELQTLLDEGLIEDPIITPILDLDPLKREAFGISGAFNNATSAMLASSAMTGYDNNREIELLNDVLAEEGSRNDITFNQYNNSPKALNSTDIYRQTRNQLAIVKKGLPL